MSSATSETGSVHLLLQNVHDFLEADKPDVINAFTLPGQDFFSAFPFLVAPWEETTARFTTSHLRWVSSVGEEPIRATLNIKAWCFDMNTPVEVWSSPGCRWILVIQTEPSVQGTVLGRSEYLLPIAADGSWATDKVAWENFRRMARLTGVDDTESECKCGFCHALELITLARDEAWVRDNQHVAEHFRDFVGIFSEIARAVLLFAFNLAHCKNVTIQDVPLNRAARRRQQRNGEESIIWKVLTIPGVVKEAAKGAHDAQERLERALHICRGHFAEFTPQRPLFGKYSGRFWIPQHLRGVAKKGIVLKDYEVKPE